MAHRQSLPLSHVLITLLTAAFVYFIAAGTAQGQTHSRAKALPKDTVKVCAQFLQLGYPHEETLTTVPFMVLKDGIDTTTLTIPRNVKADQVIIMKDWYNFLFVDGKVVSIAPVSRRKRCPYKASA